MNRLLRFWDDPRHMRDFRSAVCLHGHTMHSEECLSFLPSHLKRIPGLRHVIEKYQRNGADFSKAYWTPPLTPEDAWGLELPQISGLGLHALISITDHDDIHAGIVLQKIASRPQTPVSVEWTVPYRRTILHIGLHHIPRQYETSWMAAMKAYTQSPDERLVPELLSEFAKHPDVLIVLNHPFWLEEGVSRTDHEESLPVFLRECIRWIHAFEYNGTRPWPENAAATHLARRYAKPVVSGGDRHACEPAACLNLSNALSFDEFVSEVRDGQSTVVIMPQYLEPMALRLFEAAWDILRPYPQYPTRTKWTDRCFYRNEDGVARPLSEVWEEHTPWILNPTTSLLRFAANSQFRPAIRFLLSANAEALP